MRNITQGWVPGGVVFWPNILSILVLIGIRIRLKLGCDNNGAHTSAKSSNMRRSKTSRFGLNQNTITNASKGCQRLTCFPHEPGSMRAAYRLHKLGQLMEINVKCHSKNSK